MMRCSYVILSALLLASGAVAETTLHVGGVVDVRSGKLRDNQLIVIDDERIVSIGRADDVPADAIDLTDYIATPGLIDAHVHLLSDTANAGYKGLGLSLPTRTIHGVANALTTLRAGVTTVRNVGAPGYGDVALRDAINSGLVPGPRMVTAGLSIGITGGHCSDQNLLPHEWGAVGDGVADGPWAMRAKVRQNAKFGVDMIKTCSTGGVLSKRTRVGAPQGSLEELEAIVEEAHALGFKVASHAHGAEGINNALRAGVDSVEHASLLDDESIRLAKRSGAALVMDIYVTEYILGKGSTTGILSESLRKERLVGRRQRENFRKAHEAGVRLVFGTDAGVYPHGDNLKQLSRMVTWGMTPAEVLRAATLHAAELLGLEGEVGELAEGHYADLVLTRANPLEDVSVLEDVEAVMKGGEWVRKSPAVAGLSSQ